MIDDDLYEFFEKIGGDAAGRKPRHCARPVTTTTTNTHETVTYNCPAIVTSAQRDDSMRPCPHQDACPHWHLKCVCRLGTGRWVCVVSNPSCTRLK